MSAGTNTPTFAVLLFLGGPLHGSRHEMPRTTQDLYVRNLPDKTYSPNGWDRYTRRRFTRIAGDEHPEAVELFAHETWLDEEIGAANIPEELWKPCAS